jgi:DnaJ-class molecular chaperone
MEEVTIQKKLLGWIECPTCKGFGHTVKGECLKCKGTGLIRKIHNIEDGRNVKKTLL